MDMEHIDNHKNKRPGRAGCPPEIGKRVKRTLGFNLPERRQLDKEVKEFNEMHDMRISQAEYIRVKLFYAPEKTIWKNLKKYYTYKASEDLNAIKKAMTNINQIAAKLNTYAANNEVEKLKREAKFALKEASNAVWEIANYSHELYERIVKETEELKAKDNRLEKPNDCQNSKS